MIDERTKKFRYELGDAMGDYAPDYFRRGRSTMNGWLIGAGGMIAAVAIGYVALRLADKRLQDVIDRISPRFHRNGRERQPVKGEGSGRTPQGRAERPDRESTERPTVHGTEGGEMPTTQPR